MAIVNAAVSAGVVTEGPSTSEVTTGPRRRLTQTQTPPASSKSFVKDRAYIGHILLKSFSLVQPVLAMLFRIEWVAGV